MKKGNKSNATVWRILCAMGAFTLTMSVAGTAVTREWSGYINKVLGIESTKIELGNSGEALFTSRANSASTPT